MTRRRVLCGLLLASLVLACFAGWLVWRAVAKPERVRAYEQLALGMTRTEVNQAIGVPPGRYTAKSWDQPSQLYLREAGIPAVNLYEYELTRDTDVKVEKWKWDDYWIFVAFDGEGKSVGCYLLSSGPPGPTLTQQIRHWLLGQ
jgi:hypothetical protein